MFRSVLRHIQVPVVTVLLLLGFLAAAPSSGAIPYAAAGEENETVFHGAATQWVWTVRGDATLEDGNHIDTGHLQVAAACLGTDVCEGEFTFTGALGTATCGQSGGVTTGYMSLYAGASFECVSVSFSVSGLGVCEASLNARGIEMGVHRLAGTGAAMGACAVV